jgi:uncharacterized protein YprB with RNaseH-like and TPR domain
MDLRQKLAMLSAPRLPAAAPRASSNVEFVAADPDAPTPGEAAIDSALTPRERVLSELRRKVAEVLGRPSLPRRIADPSATLLPFERMETASGVIYRRLERLLPSHHVGRIPVDSAASVSAELIALLALDPRLAGVRFERALFLDTETTGLGGAGVLPFLVGLAWFDDGKVMLEQLLLRRPGDERGLLEHLRGLFERAEVLVTYNGKTFDLPLLNGRYVMNHLPPVPVRPHLDLLHLARRLHKKRIGQCRLISLESRVLGFERGPDIEGADVAARYGHFLRSGDEASLEAVVSHNAWDVLSMAALLGLYGEPMSLLPAEDLVGLARTLRRAGALDAAADAAEVAVSRGGSASARRARGEIAKARGDRARALADFESLLAEVDEPLLRLELVKLYEHYVKSPEQALALLEQGTGEGEAAILRRRARLERKARRQLKPAL